MEIIDGTKPPTANSYGYYESDLLSSLDLLMFFHTYPLLFVVLFLVVPASAFEIAVRLMPETPKKGPYLFYIATAVRGAAYAGSLALFIIVLIANLSAFDFGDFLIYVMVGFPICIAIGALIGETGYFFLLRRLFPGQSRSSVTQLYR